MKLYAKIHTVSRLTSDFSQRRFPSILASSLNKMVSVHLPVILPALLSKLTSLFSVVLVVVKGLTCLLSMSPLVPTDLYLPAVLYYQLLKLCSADSSSVAPGSCLPLVTSWELLVPFWRPSVERMAFYSIFKSKLLLLVILFTSETLSSLTPTSDSLKPIDFRLQRVSALRSNLLLPGVPLCL